MADAKMILECCLCRQVFLALGSPALSACATDDHASEPAVCLKMHVAAIINDYQTQNRDTRKYTFKNIYVGA